ncbi:protein ATAF2-like [Telopea speciosissima]|uniref:protein ATAF2-like n=1 Tax=Telopea speciosissima TaxID=54955 RepID=UPI001CC48721|nr:protein ATAF2-like [Telopea speciosissima]
MSESSEINIPVGFRFIPIEKELVCDYLAKKVSSCTGNKPQFSSMVVVDSSDVYNKHPWLLVVSTKGAAHRMNRDGAIYFFVPMSKKNANGWRPNRRIGDMGFWKSTSSSKPVMDGHGNVLGMKRSLVYYVFAGDDKNSSSKDGSKTSWIMHEYNLVDPKNPNKKEFQEWTLCRISNSGRRNSSSTMEGDIQPGKTATPMSCYCSLLSTDQSSASGNKLFTDEEEEIFRLLLNEVIFDDDQFLLDKEEFLLSKRKKSGSP